MSPGHAAAAVAVLASGEGSNLQALLDAAARGELGGEIRLVISDRAQAPALARAREAGIAVRFIDPATHATRAAYGATLQRSLEEAGIELVVLAGFMRILDPRLVEDYAGRMLNIHPSLLPRHRGLHTHRRALEAGDRLHGATVHFVIPALDAGPGVAQFRIAVQPWDSEASLAARVRLGEHALYPRVVRWVLEGRIAWEAGEVRFDGRRLRTPLVLSCDGLAFRSAAA